MSHGPSSDDTVDPNLTPLLDLVLQLLMLFMICGNYAAEQSNEPVNLAYSETAKQLGDEAKITPGPEEDFLFLTIKPYHPETNAGDLANHLKSSASVLEKYKDGDAYVLIVGHDAMRAEPDGELLVWLGQQHSDLERKSKDGQVHTSVVIRPDGDLDYAMVYRILKFCKDKGFTNLKVRAMIGKGVSK